jgi:hypothetical protein
MIEGQKVVERTTFCRRSTNKDNFSTDMHGCIFHSYSVLYNFCKALFSKPPTDHLANNSEPHFQKHWPGG